MSTIAILIPSFGREKKDVIYRNFRAGDIRHSNANIEKAHKLLGYTPTHDIYQGMEAAIEWYIEDLNKNPNTKKMEPPGAAEN